MAPVPKKKHSKQRSRIRRGAKKISLPNLGKCPSCGKYKLPHVICPHCGHVRRDSKK